MYRTFKPIIALAALCLAIEIYKVYNSSRIFHDSFLQGFRGAVGGIIFWCSLIIFSYMKNLFFLGIALIVDFVYLLLHSFLPIYEEILLGLKQRFLFTSLSSFLGGLSIALYLLVIFLTIAQASIYFKNKIG